MPKATTKEQSARKTRLPSSEELRRFFELARSLAPPKRRFKVETIPFGMEK